LSPDPKLRRSEESAKVSSTGRQKSGIGPALESHLFLHRLWQQRRRNCRSRIRSLSNARRKSNLRRPGQDKIISFSHNTRKPIAPRCTLIIPRRPSLPPSLFLSFSLCRLIPVETVRRHRVNLARLHSIRLSSNLSRAFLQQPKNQRETRAAIPPGARDVISPYIVWRFARVTEYPNASQCSFVLHPVFRGEDLSRAYEREKKGESACAFAFPSRTRARARTRASPVSLRHEANAAPSFRKRVSAPPMCFLTAKVLLFPFVRHGRVPLDHSRAYLGQSVSNR